MARQERWDGELRSGAVRLSLGRDQLASHRLDPNAHTPRMLECCTLLRGADKQIVLTNNSGAWIYDAQMPDRLRERRKNCYV